MSKTIIGVMGPGEGATEQNIKHAQVLGKLIAEENWVLLTGGRDVGVMNAASKGAKEAGGLTIGILPTEDRKKVSEFVDIPVSTGMGSARNNINVLTPDVVIACGTGAGTTSEIMLALKAQKPLILLSSSTRLQKFISELPYPDPPFIQSPAQVIPRIKSFL